MSEQNDRLGGHRANNGSAPKGIRAEKSWDTEAEIVVPGGPTRVVVRKTAGWEEGTRKPGRK